LNGGTGKHERYGSDQGNGDGVQGKLGGHWLFAYTRSLRREILDVRKSAEQAMDGTRRSETSADRQRPTIPGRTQK